MRTIAEGGLEQLSLTTIITKLATTTANRGDNPKRYMFLRKVGIDTCLCDSKLWMP